MEINKNGTLTYLDHSFVFQNGKDKYYFAVNKPEERTIKNSFQLKFKKENEFYGTGIIFYKLDKNLKENKNFLNDLKKARNSMEYLMSRNDVLNTERLPEPPTCQSGGQGSTGCSSTAGSNSCSVSCSSGYYSCCNSGTSCGCYNSITHILQPKEFSDDVE